MAAPPYSDGSLGRLAFSYACRDLSDLARAHVSTYADGHLRPGELLEEATRLVAGAEATLRMAVVAERLRGTSWAEIGEALGVTRQSAHERYASFEREMRVALLFPDRAGENAGLGWWAVPDGLEDPERTARDLDAWERRHREATDPDRGETAVSAGLQTRCVTSAGRHAGARRARAVRTQGRGLRAHARRRHDRFWRGDAARGSPRTSGRAHVRGDAVTIPASPSR